MPTYIGVGTRTTFIGCQQNFPGTALWLSNRKHWISPIQTYLYRITNLAISGSSSLGKGFAHTFRLTPRLATASIPNWYPKKNLTLA